MKNIFLFLITLSSVCTFGQQRGMDNPRDPEAREKIRAAHAAYITERIGLTSSESEKFWPVYREYNEKKRELRQELRRTSPAEADHQKQLEMDLKLKQEELDLEKEYTGKLQQIIPAEKLVKLKQAEMDFRRLILRRVQERQRHRR
jgi:hypothetical protein